MAKQIQETRELVTDYLFAKYFSQNGENSPPKKSVVTEPQSKANPQKYPSRLPAPEAPLKGEPLAGREATAPSIIIEIREVQWREETSPNGGVVTPKYIQMQPFRFKSKLNPILDVKVFVGPGGSDGLPGGLADFDSGHPGLLEHFVEGVAVVKVLTTPLGPKVVQNEGSEDVERLPEVSEATNVVGVESGRVVFAFDGGLAKQSEGPIDGDALGSFPFLPNCSKHALGMLRERAVQEAMLRGLKSPNIAGVAGGKDPHHL